MKKRGILKLLAFLAGLYFVLEFLLPVKVGGSWDSYEVSSPAPFRGPDLRLLYSGKYADKSGGVGLLVAGPDGWRRATGGPVLSRTPSHPEDMSGMEQLRVVAVNGRNVLLYFGVNREGVRTLCTAEGNTAGTSWKRTAPVRFGADGPPVWSSQAPNGLFPGIKGSLRFFAADHDGALWRMLVVFAVPGAGFSIHEAEGESLQDMRLRETPTLGVDRVPRALTAFGAELTQSGWRMDYGLGNEWRRVVLDTRGAVRSETVQLRLREGETLTGISGDYVSTSRAAEPAPPPEASPNATAIVWPSASSPEERVILTPGHAPKPTYVSRASDLAGNFVAILAAFPVFLAMVNLSIYHGKKVVKGRKDRGFSLVFFLCLSAMLYFTLRGRGPEAEGTVYRGGYDMLFEGILRPVGTAIFSTVTFYMISAAYRSFRIRNVESVLLLMSAAIVMLGQTPVGEWSSHLLPDALGFLGLPVMSQKLLTVFNASAIRGVLIGTAIGALAVSIRTWLGLDASPYTGLGDD